MLKAIKRYIVNVLLGLDQLGNTITGGSPDETISARVGRRQNVDPLAKVIAEGLNTIDPGHTEHAIESEKTGRQQAEAYKGVYHPECEK